MISKYHVEDLNQLARDITTWRAGKGFDCPAGISTPEDRVGMNEKLMLVVTEVAEACEAVRHVNILNFCEEIADTMIRLLDICGAGGIDIAREIAYKMDKNEARPFKHGKAC